MFSKRISQLEPSIIREMSNRRRPTSIDLSLGEPALPPDPGLLERAFAKLKAGPQGYTHNAGLMELRKGLAELHRFPGKLAAENVIVTVGSEEALYLAMSAVLDAGDGVLAPDPGYPAYLGITRVLGAQHLPFSVSRDEGLMQTASAIERAYQPGAKVLILNSPSNPFGTIISRSELERIARFAAEKDLVVISDEIYRDLYYGQDAPSSICELMESRSLFVGGLSKSCAMTGLRVGYLMGEESFIKKATLLHQLIVTCASRLAQLAALEVTLRPEMLRAHVPFYQLARARIAELMPAFPPEHAVFLGDGAFYAIVDVESAARGDPLALALRLLDEADVVAVPGLAFGKSGAWFLRLSYAAGADTVGEGLSRLAAFLERA